MEQFIIHVGLDVHKAIACSHFFPSPIHQIIY